MTCSRCCFNDAADRQFTAEKVAAELDRYRKKGPGSTTRMLRDGVVSVGLNSGRVIDVGAGFGALTHELLDRGMTAALIVEASSAYLRAASEEAAIRGRTDAVESTYGDFVTLADQLPPAAVVTLDRVVCCYPSYERLLRASVQHAERGIAMSYPRNRWFVRVALGFENALRWWRGNAFRVYVHSPTAMRRLLAESGFAIAWRRRTIMWAADVFRRVEPASAGTIHRSPTDVVRDN